MRDSQFILGQGLSEACPNVCNGKTVTTFKAIKHYIIKYRKLSTFFFKKKKKDIKIN